MNAPTRPRDRGLQAEADRRVSRPQRAGIRNARVHEDEPKWRGAVDTQTELAPNLIGVALTFNRRKDPVRVRVDIANDRVGHRDARRQVHLETHTVGLHADADGLEQFVVSMR